MTYTSSTTQQFHSAHSVESHLSVTLLAQAMGTSRARDAVERAVAQVAQAVARLDGLNVADCAAVQDALRQILVFSASGGMVGLARQTVRLEDALAQRATLPYLNELKDQLVLCAQRELADIWYTDLFD
jgi:hypothetical protein